MNVFYNDIEGDKEKEVEEKKKKICPCGVLSGCEENDKSNYKWYENAWY